MKQRTNSAHPDLLAPPPACRFPAGAAIGKHDLEGQPRLPDQCRQTCSPERCPVARLCASLSFEPPLKN